MGIAGDVAQNCASLSPGDAPPVSQVFAVPIREQKVSQKNRWSRLRQAHVQADESAGRAARYTLTARVSPASSDQ